MPEHLLNYLNQRSSLLKNKEFLSLTTPRDQMEFILRNVKPLHLFRDDVFEAATSYSAEHCKSALRSELFREEGLQYSQRGDNRNACHMFTKALLSAPIPTEVGIISELCLNFAHKSLAEYRLKSYENSLSSAIHSLQLCETIDMLFQRVYCLKGLKRFSEALDCIEELIRRHNEKEIEINDQYLVALNAIKGVVQQNISLEKCQLIGDVTSESLIKDLDDCGVNVWLHPNCQLMRTERKGRHGVAKQLIPEGTVVLLEHPSSIVLSAYKKNICSNCFKMIGTNVWPCFSCDELVFCDQQCSTEAYEKYHKYECGISGLIDSLGHGFAHIFRLFSRVGIQKVFECEKRFSINQFFDFDNYLEAKRQKIATGSQFEDIEEDDTSFEKEFEAFYSLIYHNSDADKIMNVVHCFKAIQLSLLFNYSNQLDFDIEQQFDQFITFTDICYKNSKKVLNNVFGWWQTFSHNIISGSRTHLGSSVCTVSALLNHSCDPNIFWYFRGPLMVFVTKKNINEGEEMCVTYGPIANGWKILDRQIKLKTNYHFDCNCEACLRECKTILCFRCEYCSGPVVYMGRAHPKRKDRCLQCGEEFPNLSKTAAKVKALNTRFEQMINNLENNSNIVWSLNVAKNMVRSLLQLVYAECEPLKNCWRQLLKAYLRHQQFAESVRFIDTSGPSLDLNLDLDESFESTSATTLADLCLMANCYYQYLNSSQVLDTNHWNNCFDLYSKLISFLKKVKKVLKEKSVDNQNFVPLVDKFRVTIKDKKQELTQLMNSYQAIGHQMNAPLIHI